MAEIFLAAAIRASRTFHVAPLVACRTHVALVLGWLAPRGTTTCLNSGHVTFASSCRFRPSLCMFVCHHAAFRKAPAPRFAALPAGAAGKRTAGGRHPERPADRAQLLLRTCRGARRRLCALRRQRSCSRFSRARRLRPQRTTRAAWRGESGHVAASLASPARRGS